MVAGCARGMIRVRPGKSPEAQVMDDAAFNAFAGRDPGPAAAIPPGLLSNLIGSIYDCTLDPARWPATLAAICDAMASESAILSLSDRRQHRPLIDVSVGWDEDWLAERNRHIPEIHAALDRWQSGAPPPDAPFVASRTLSPTEVAGSAYAERCLGPLGIVDVMHLILLQTPTHFSEIVLMRHHRHGTLTDREVTLAGLLLPHLRRAVTISNLLDLRQIESACLTEALDALPGAVMLVDRNCGIVHANAAAERMLGAGNAVTKVRGGLRARSDRADRALREVVAHAGADEARLDGDGRPVLLSGAGTSSCLAHVLPLTGSRFRAGLKPRAVAAVILGPAAGAAVNQHPEAVRENLRLRYGLTRAEADVALEVIRGDGRSAAAHRLGISPSTVRAHLSRVFEKTGVRRQAELVRLLLDGTE